MFHMPLFEHQFSQKRTLRHALHKSVTVLLLAALLAGLIPPPAVSGLIRSITPKSFESIAEAVAEPAAQFTEGLSAPRVAAAQTSFFTVLIEAENFSSKVASTGVDTDAWTQVADGTASGGQAMQSLDNDGTNYATTPDCCDGSGADEAALMSFDINVPMGIYTVTETSPGAGWVTTYTVDTADSATSGLVDLTSAGAIVPVAPAALSGMVYHDYNSNGQLDLTATFTETGASGIVITAYGPAGAACGSTSSDVNGNYSFTPTCDGPWRLSFSGLPAGYEPSAQGAENGASTQFVSSAPVTDLNFAINRPCDYCQSDPFLITPLYRFGAYNGGHATSSALRGGRMSWGITKTATYTLSEISVTQVDANGNPAPPVDFAEHNEIGATWGIAWNRSAEQLYMGAFIKAHAGLGPNGPGAIYQLPIDPAAGTATAAPTLFADLAADGYTVCADPHGADLNSSPSPHDPVISAVGRCGLGDLDIAEDDATLYVVNLTSREIVAYDTATATPTNDWAFPLNQDTLPANDGFCADPATDIWPFALEWHNDMLYVGATCTAMSTADVTDMWGYVYRLDPATGQFTLVLNWDIVGEGTYTNRIPWRNSWATLTAAPTFIDGSATVGQVNAYQAWLADIAFYGEDLILGMRDRTGDQSGYRVPNTANVAINSGSNVGTISQFISGVGHGDVVCAARTGVDQYTIEDANTGQCGDRMPGQAPKSETGEFYMDGELGHGETSFAGLELVPGFPLVQTIVNPTEFLSLSPRIFNSGGFAWADAADGRALRGYHLYGSSGVQSMPGTLGKVNGLGDIEALCDPAPIEIGNRVWDDYDGDGEQDAGEPGLNGLTVTLQTPSGISTTTTNGDGNYYFSVEPYTTYTITVATPAGYQLTAANAAALDAANLTSNHAISDTIDSDVLLVNGAPTIIYTTGGPGQNNHGLDFGFSLPPVVLGDRLWVENDGDGIATTGVVSSVGAGRVVSATNGTTVYTGTTNASGYYSITVPANATYTVTTGLPGGLLDTPVLTSNGTNPVGNNDRNHNRLGTSVVMTTTNNLSIDFGFWSPVNDYALSKRTNTPSPVRIGETISFTIRITNTGTVTLTTVPLRDTYVHGELVYASAVPTPNTAVAGQLDWTDLTAAAPNGFGYDLAPGQSFVITTTFAGVKDTTNLPGGVTVNTAAATGLFYDIDGPGGTPPQPVDGKPPVTATVAIVAPTAINLADASVSYVSGDGLLSWRTLNEGDVIGFNIYRSMGDGIPVRLTDAMILAQKPGQSEGAEYAYTDAGLEIGKRYSYTIEFIGVDGPLGQHEIGTLFTGARLFLPTVGR